MREPDDIGLLRDYGWRHSEDAFAAIVRRYVNLVYSVAFRSVANSDAAEEITQAVFIILARKARSLSRRTVLSGWLYHAARLTAGRFLRTEIRRQNREREAYMQSLANESEPQTTWPQIAPLLDAAMDRLGKKDREALVLRYFENKNLREVGVGLGASEAAAKMRVNRALEKLREVFTERGVTFSGGAIGAAVSANSVHAAPAGLAHADFCCRSCKGRGGEWFNLSPRERSVEKYGLVKSKGINCCRRHGDCPDIGHCAFRLVRLWQPQVAGGRCCARDCARQGVRNPSGFRWQPLGMGRARHRPFPGSRV